TRSDRDWSSDVCSSDLAVAKQLAKQTQETEKFMSAKFLPETMGSPLLIAAPLSPEAAKGKKLFADNSCDGCHGDNAQGTSNGPKIGRASCRERVWVAGG